jgi:hypothetical protein
MVAVLIGCAVLATFLVWLIFAGLVGNLLPILCGALIAILIHRLLSQHLTTLGGLTRKKSRPED